MNFFKSKPKPDANPGASTASWQSIASGDSTTLHFQQPDNNNSNSDDGSGFLHPESSITSNRALQTSEWSKERTSQQLELEDVHDNRRAGCCRQIIEFLIKSLQVVDASFGIALIVYGSLICTQFEQPAMAAATFCLIFGTIHLVTSVLGIVSLFVKVFSRFGLLMSAYIGPYISLVYFTMVISLLADSSGFLQYLDDNKEVMYLGPNVAENCRKLLPLFYTLLIGLGLLEASRFCVLVKIRDRLCQRDAADPLIPRSHNTGSSSPSSTNNALTEALLEENKSERVETGGGAVERETTGTPNWWDKER